MSITKKQKEVLDYITSYTRKNGISPTQKEIKEHFNFKSFGSVQRYIKYLANAGFLESDWNARRGLKVVDETPAPSHTPDVTEVPLLGKVAAGIPIEAIEQADESIPVPSSMVQGSHHYFALKVKGDSMIEDGIFEDDLIVCRHQANASNGQTVVAVIEGEATVKRYKKHRSHIELIPANSTMEPILVDQTSGAFSIAGILVGLIRSYV
ncbi:MAG: transcriptional repressor LexA [Bacteriovoracaceae bacterium]|nr:transcriptional repressor LexA [Bacteriovoracaceae bacterium]